MVFTSNQLYTIFILVRQGLGISFVDESFISSMAGLVTVPLTLDFSYDIWAVWKKNRTYSNYVRQFVHFLSSLDYDQSHESIVGLLSRKED